nr:protein kinase [Actinomycetales bacterium]
MEEIGGYRLVRRLGAGGMGTVWEALDAEDRAVALKVLHPHISQDPGARQRLEREVRLLHRVRGPRIARVLDAEVEASEAFVVTELIDGLTLEEDVRARGPFTPNELANLARGLSEALHTIHAADVVHRDLKPSNVMISATGPVIIDFGIAQVADDVRLTQTGMVTGTPGYLDPEIVDGAPPSSTCDWWAWAAVLVFAATGRQPFGTGPHAAIFHRLHTGAVDVEGLEPASAAALRAALLPSSTGRLHPAAVLATLEGRISRSDLTRELVQLGLDDDAHPAPPISIPPSGSSPVTPAHQAGAAHTRALPHGVNPTRALPQGGDSTRVAPAPDPNRTRAVPAPGYGTEAPASGSTAVMGPGYGQDQTRVASSGYAPPGYGTPGYGPAGSGLAGYGTPGYGPAGGGLAPPGPGYAPDPYAHPGAAPPPQQVPEWLVPAASRSGMVASIGLLLAALGMVWPGPVLLAFAVLLLVSAATGYGVRSLRGTRLRRGLRSGDLARSALAAPWHLLRGLLLVVFLLGVGLGIGWIILQGAFLTVPELRDAESQIADHIAMGGGAGLVMLTSWFTPGAERVRDGARTVLGAAFPFRTMRVVLILLCCALAVLVVGFVLMGSLSGIHWAPVPEPVWL